ncbi:hypothetical protein BGZ96_006580 [Linnemannia gamsii]|uniref:RING-type domain-containing protein n=1 Tax=Linnemannia gamsii TaxID=64522 RepID=A0ABQ7KFY5_9FUNG|nr:hypothetical protein BGZ96_006580 [Linnemannia gamsii]
MNRSRNPPIFTSHGYQPSILMGTSSQKNRASTRQRRFPPQVQVSTSAAAASSTEAPGIAQPPPPPLQVDYIPIWLYSEVPQQAFTFTPPPMHFQVPDVVADLTMFMPMDPPRQECFQSAATSAISESSIDASVMDWATCPTSPMSVMSRIVPNLDWRSIPPSPSPSPSQADAMVVSPVSMVFQQRSMLPELPFQGRSRSIFLSDQLPGSDGVNSRVRDLLHNTAIQRIRTWFLETIEPNALAQWANRSLFDQMSRQAGAAALSESMPITVSSDNNTAAAVNKECAICYQVEDIVKVISGCNHEICWKCEADLDRFGNISCPLCRGLRLATNYKSPQGLFATTIGIHSSDYTHRLCPQPGINLERQRPLFNVSQPWYEDYDVDRAERDARVEHELSDRYLWEPSASFLEHLASMKDHPAKQYFQLNAAQDLCFKPSNDDHLREYNDRIPLNPPMSGLVLPPHRLYIVLIHFCLDMLTLPNPARFQNQRKFKSEQLLLELVTLFLVPTDEFSPRYPDRIYNASAWIQQGDVVLTRIRRFMRTKITQHKAETATEEGEIELGVPSTPISQEILYLGVARWSWIAQSLNNLLKWIQLAESNPSMVPPEAHYHLGKHQEPCTDPDPRPTKRQRHHRRWMSL